MRRVQRIIPSIETHEGEGFLVHRPFPVRGLSYVDPFLLIDEMGPKKVAPGEAKGAPDHPHRGFETITYLLAGSFVHEDSQGSRSQIGPGDAQWMTAGSGVIHSEMPGPEIMKDGGVMHGFQIWVNLPREKKMMKPRYQDLKDAQIPRVELAPGVRAKLLGGSLGGGHGPAHTEIPILYAHLELAPGAKWKSDEVNGDWSLLAYVIAGEGSFSGSPSTPRANLIHFESRPGAITIENTSTSQGLSLLLLAGEPLGEPVARMGPFVMNTREELAQAYDDYVSGRLGKIRR